MTLGPKVAKNVVAHAVHTTNLSGRDTSEYDGDSDTEDDAKEEKDSIDLTDEDHDRRRQARESLIAEMQKARRLGVKTLVFQCAFELSSLTTVLTSISVGSCGDQDREKVLHRLVKDIRKMLGTVPDVTLAIENMVSYHAPIS